MVYLKQGSVFDTKCDVLILPCDSNGGMTSWVRQEIEDYNLPMLNRKIPYGKVYFSELLNNYGKASSVGFAASVQASTITSSKEANISILNIIIKYCLSESFSIINIPLLGTGAGKLDYSDVISLYQEYLSKISLEFNVYIPDKTIANLFIEDTENIVTKTLQYTNPRVFVSYCRKDKNIEDWVTILVTKLRENGVDAILDKFHLKPGVDLPQWMTNEILKAQKVLLICDKNYAERADTRNAGVGWETMIIQGDMLVQGENNSKYIAIACDGFDKNIPIYIKTKLGLSKDQIDNDLNMLLTNIFEIDIAPELGEIPQWVKDKIRKQNIA
jgi:hypothetical protein